MDEVKKTFRPEFLNRIDEIIVFHQLTEENVKEIAEIMISNLTNRLKENGIKIKVDEGAKALVAKKGFDVTYGARPLRRAIQTMIEDKIAESMLDSEEKKSKTLKITTNEDEIVVKK